MTRFTERRIEELERQSSDERVTLIAIENDEPTEAQVAFADIARRRGGVVLYLNPTDVRL